MNQPFTEGHSSTDSTKKKNRFMWMTITATAGAVLTTVCLWIHPVLGYVLFFAIPLVMSAIPAYLSTQRYSDSGWTLFTDTMGAFVICSGLLFLFGIEGAICIVMASPIFVVLGSAGVYFGRRLAMSSQSRMQVFAGFGVLAIVSAAVDVLDSSTEIVPVTTTVTINAPQSVVWDNVINVKDLPPPTELIFRAGISYPMYARIDGHGVGAIRRCVFSTGAFVEPITVWDAPHRLAFDVQEMPEPMKELSPWDIHPAHLHGFVVTTRGEFRLDSISSTTTRLVGTTWYRNIMRPTAYWNLWTDVMIHAIHERVLRTIVTSSEASFSQR